VKLGKKAGKQRDMGGRKEGKENDASVCNGLKQPNCVQQEEKSVVDPEVEALIAQIQNKSEQRYVDVRDDARDSGDDDDRLVLNDFPSLHSMPPLQSPDSLLADFPSLSSTKPVSNGALASALDSAGPPAAPPGFSAAAPAAGLAAVPALLLLPPGFSTPAMASAAPVVPSVTCKPAPGLSAPAAPPPGLGASQPITLGTFINPPDFENRNMTLIATIQSVLASSPLFEIFKSVSRDFRAGQVTAAV
jgi:hypothetical protein